MNILECQRDASPMGIEESECSGEEPPQEGSRFYSSFSMISDMPSRELLFHYPPLRAASPFTRPSLSSVLTIQMVQHFVSRVKSLTVPRASFGYAALYHGVVLCANSRDSFMYTEIHPRGRSCIWCELVSGFGSWTLVATALPSKELGHNSESNHH